MNSLYYNKHDLDKTFNRLDLGCISLYQWRIQKNVIRIWRFSLLHFGKCESKLSVTFVLEKSESHSSGPKVYLRYKKSRSGLFWFNARFHHSVKSLLLPLKMNHTGYKSHKNVQKIWFCVFLQYFVVKSNDIDYDIVAKLISPLFEQFDWLISKLISISPNQNACLGN